MPATEFDQKGYSIIPGFVSDEVCGQILRSIEEYRKRHPVPVVHREAGSRSLHYAVIDGQRIRDHLSPVTDLAAEVGELICSLTDRPVVPLEDEKVAVNINITPRGGTYRWHYDRNAVTAILYLNAVQGGETECYPNYRLNFSEGTPSAVQKILDSVLQLAAFRYLFGKRVLVAPQPGTLLVMAGNKCLHSVRPVKGPERVNVIISFDSPGKIFEVAGGLNKYLYDTGSSDSGDPNYV